MDDFDDTLPNDPVVSFDYRFVKPTPEQKMLLVNRVLHKVESALALSTKCHIKRKHSTELSDECLKGHSLLLNRGRLYALDQNGQPSIISYHALLSDG